jgi:nucleoside transporter
MATPTKKPGESLMSEIATPTAEVGVVPMDLGIRAKLSIMMFLQYFLWGAWFVSMSSYISKTLEFSDAQKGLIYSTSPIGAMVAPFFVGMIADRFFATERILAVLHLAGGVLLIGLSMTSDYETFLPLMLVFFLCYMPTLALTNSLTFSHVNDPERQFPGIRVLGTIGWIVAGLLVGYLDIGLTNQQLQLGAAASVVLAVFCLTLPHTPPPKANEPVKVRDVLGLDALALMKSWSFSIFVLGSFLICIPLQFYYSFAEGFLKEIGVENAVGKMTYGQMSEIFFMLVMPFFFVRLGVKYMLLVGMAAWALRYFLFSLGNTDEGMWMLYAGILLHGICYDFFFVTGYIYVDKKAPDAIRASAQGFITFITWGVGGFIGSNLAGTIGQHYTIAQNAHDWAGFWRVPALFATVVLVLFALTFYDRVDSSAAESPAR